MQAEATTTFDASDRIAALKRSLAPRRDVLTRAFQEVRGFVSRAADAVQAKAAAGQPVVPEVEYREIRDGKVSDYACAEIRRTGCAVVRGVFPASVARGWFGDLGEYLASRSDRGARPVPGGAARRQRVLAHRHLPRRRRQAYRPGARKRDVHRLGARLPEEPRVSAAADGCGSGCGRGPRPPVPAWRSGPCRSPRPARTRPRAIRSGRRSARRARPPDQGRALHPDVDGALVGGASLEVGAFVDIVARCRQSAV